MSDPPAARHRAHPVSVERIARVLAPFRRPARITILALTLTTAGCLSRHVEKVPAPPLPMEDAVAFVNHNATAIGGTLRGIGNVDGRWKTGDGRGTSFHVDGVLFFLQPMYVRFDLKRFGDRKLLLGSNDTYYWAYDGEQDEYICGRHDDPEPLPPEIPIPPQQLADAFGLAPIPTPTTETLRVQRVVDDYQQILWIQRNAQGKTTVQKEYWLDRYDQRLIRRVVFRDPDGVVQMQSELEDYEAVSPDGPWLPRSITARWPETGTWLRFRVRQWTTYPDIGPNGIQFATPRDCLDQTTGHTRINSPRAASAQRWGS